MLRNINIGLRLGISFGTIILCMAALGLAAIAEISNMHQVSRNLYLHPYTVTRSLREIDTGLAKMQSAMQGLVLGQPQSRSWYEDELEKLSTVILSKFDILDKRYLGDPAQPREARQLFLGWRKIVRELLQQIDRGKPVDGMHQSLAKMSGLLERIDSVLAQMKTFAAAKARSYLRQGENYARNRYLAFGLGLAVLLALATLFTVVITRGIVGPARSIIDQAQAVATGTPAPADIYRGKDELGQLAATLEKILAEVIGESLSIKHGLPVAFWTTDEQLNVTFLNPAAQRMTMEINGEILGSSLGAGGLLLAVFPDRDGAVARMAAETLASGERRERQVVFPGSDGGRHFQVFTSPINELDGKASGVMGIALDVTQRQRYQERLRVSEESFHNIFDAVREGILVFASTGSRLLEMNESAERMLGYHLTELQQMEVQDLSGPQNQLSPRKLALAMMKAEAGQPQVVEWHLRTKSGECFWAEASFSSPHIGGDKRILAVISDISQRKEAEGALLDSVDRFRLIFEQAGVGITLLDTFGKVVWSNRQLQEMVGRKEEDLLGRELAGCLLSAHQEQFRGRLAELRNGLIQKYLEETRFRRPKGDRLWAHLTVSLIRDESGRPEYFAAVANDISSHKAAQAVLESERNLRALAHNLPNAALLLMDGELNIIIAEGSILPRLVAQPAKLVGRNLNRAFSQMALSVLAPLCRQALAGETPGLEVAQQGMALKLVAVPVGAEQSQRRVMAIVQDISDFKQAQANLVAAKEMAEEANRTKTEFLTTMSHELRTPLNAIIGFSQLLAENTAENLTEKQVRQSRRILESGHHLLHLVNEILSIAQIEAGRVQADQEPVHMKSALTAALAAIGPEAGSRGIETMLTVDPEAAGLIIDSDEALINQVLQGLLSNAVKFTQEGGKVELHLKMSRDGRRAVVQVSDNGIGIPPEHQSRIFEQFVQLDSSLARRYQGSGLGLNLTKRLVGLLGGEIWVESQGEGQGSSFLFTLPAVRTDKVTALRS